MNQHLFKNRGHKRVPAHEMELIRKLLKQGHTPGEIGE